jgi:YVTN family beta-propeller protein
VLATTVDVGDAPHGVAVNTSDHRLYVANHADDTLSIVNTANYGPVLTVDVGNGPNGVAYNPANDMIYVANRNDDSVSVLRTSDYSLAKTIDVGAQPNGVAVNEVTNRVYVANYGDDTVSVIDGASNTVSDTLAVGSEPSMIAVNTDTNKTYVTLHGEAKVAVIAGAGNVSTVDLYDSAGPYGIAVDMLRNYVYVATIDSYRIVALNGNDDKYLGWAEIRRLSDGAPAPLRQIGVNPGLASGHIFATTASGDGGWDKFLLLPKGWDDRFARAHALDLNEPREGLVFEPGSNRVYATSRGDDLVAVFLDGEPVCPQNFVQSAGYEVTVCVADAGGNCTETYTR